MVASDIALRETRSDRACAKPHQCSLGALWIAKEPCFFLQVDCKNTD